MLEVQRTLTAPSARPHASSAKLTDQSVLDDSIKCVTGHRVPQSLNYLKCCVNCVIIKLLCYIVKIHLEWLLYISVLFVFIFFLFVRRKSL